jgi:hypothetical protein
MVGGRRGGGGRVVGSWRCLSSGLSRPPRGLRALLERSDGLRRIRSLLRVRLRLRCHRLPRMMRRRQLRHLRGRRALLGLLRVLLWVPLRVLRVRRHAGVGHGNPRRRRGGRVSRGGRGWLTEHGQQVKPGLVGGEHGRRRGERAAKRQQAAGVVSAGGSSARTLSRAASAAAAALILRRVKAAREPPASEHWGGRGGARG